MLISTGGNDYHVKVTGMGEPIVLLHGFTGDSRTWNELVPVLSKSWQVITVDLLGHGESSSPLDSECYSMEKAAKDMCSIFDSLQIDAAHMLGYSMGGRLALCMAVLFPKRIKKLILESSSPGLCTKEEKEERMKMDERLAARILENGIKEFVQMWEDIPLFASQKELPKEIREKIRSQRLGNSPIGLANSLRGMGTGKQPSLWNELPHIPIPVLLVCGELDVKFCKIGEEIRNLLPNAELEIFKGIGHAIHVEEPKKFGTIVKEFLLEEDT